MKYLSTRGDHRRLTFEQAVLAGLAPDGGLYIPSSIPKLPSDWDTQWSSLSFLELALEIYSLFIPSDEIDRDQLRSLVERSYSTFSHPQIAPLKTINPRLAILELWHGPTFAFKDVALQFLGNLFEFFLARQNSCKPSGSPRKRITVVGATSGDTGSAAIYGLRGKRDLSIFILHPRGRVSPIQEAQMTTVMDENVFNLAVEGTFDDCQDIVKSLFGDVEFNNQYQLGAINSINWARILAQIVYYFSSYFSIKPQLTVGQQVQYVVPTGNFGDILAGFYAKKLGLPIGVQEGCPGLIIATNSNDILTRFWESGKYEKCDSSQVSKLQHSNPQTEPVGGSSDGQQLSSGRAPNLVKATLSPAMDILVSSNFERLLFYLAFDTLTGPEQSETDRIEQSQAQVKTWMIELKTQGRFSVSLFTLTAARQMFGAGRASDEATSATIRRYYEGNPASSQEGYLVDPHTAVGLHVAQTMVEKNGSDIVQIVLATAHPAKFLEAVTKSLERLSFVESEILPDAFQGLLDKPRRVIAVEAAEVDLTKEIISREVARLFGSKISKSTSAQQPSV